MDQWHGSRAFVQNHVPASVVESWLEDVIPSTPTPSIQTTRILVPFTQDKKKKKQDKQCFC